jgi:aryl-alcohol dehydrogenase-like predicted oxidoreductase
MQISEIVYGNWITHGLQIENDVAANCVRAALDSGITTFDTADVYANGRAEEVLGHALRGHRRESLEVFTKVYWPVGPDPKGPNDTGLSRKHIMEGINGSLRRLGMEYVDLYQAHRYDRFTLLEETMEAFADVVRQGKALCDRDRAGRSSTRSMAAPRRRQIRISASSTTSRAGSHSSSIR